MPDIAEPVLRYEEPEEERKRGRKPRPAKPVDESRAEQILRIAGLLFRKRGYEQTTMRDIAEAADLTPGALYWHFKSKEEILFQHLMTYEQPMYEGARDAAQAGTPDQQLKDFVRAYVQFEMDHPYFELGWGGLARTGQLAWRLPVEQQDKFRSLEADLNGDLERILRRGIEAGVFRTVDVRTTASAIISMCNFLGAWVNPSGPIDFEKLPDRYADLTLHMVLADTHL